MEHERRRLVELLTEVERLSRGDASVEDFHGEVLRRLVGAMAAVAGGAWLLTPEGGLREVASLNKWRAMANVCLAGVRGHEALLRHALAGGAPVSLPPGEGLGHPSEGPPPGNPTTYLLLLVPIRLGAEVIGLIEVFQRSNCPTAAIPGYLQFIVLMADLAGQYHQRRGGAAFSPASG